MPSYSHCNSIGRQRERGFTLVEVLVALVVLSVGLLGMAKMVMVSSHSNDSAYLRSQATSLGYQALDSMRANLNGSSVTHSYDTAMGVMPGAAGPCVAASCNNTALALSDVYAWKKQLALALPAGTGSIATSASFPVTATVIVQWDDSVAQKATSTATNSVAGAGPQSITLETVLQ
jgi:type IV pilus assembly protein PilV